MLYIFPDESGARKASCTPHRGAAAAPREGHVDTRKQSLQAAKQAVNIDRKAEHRPGRRVLAMQREECSPHKPGLCAPSLPRHLLMHMQRLPEALAARALLRLASSACASRP